MSVTNIRVPGKVYFSLPGCPSVRDNFITQLDIEKCDNLTEIGITSNLNTQDGLLACKWDLKKALSMGLFITTDNIVIQIDYVNGEVNSHLQQAVNRTFKTYASLSISLSEEGFLKVCIYDLVTSCQLYKIVSDALKEVEDYLSELHRYRFIVE